MQSPFQSFFVNLLSLALLAILGGLSFLIFDRLVLDGKYTSPYDKNAVIKNLGVDLNHQIQNNNELRQQLNSCGNSLENTRREFEAMPMYQLNRYISDVIGPDPQVILEKY